MYNFPSHLIFTYFIMLNLRNGNWRAYVIVEFAMRWQTKDFNRYTYMAYKKTVPFLGHPVGFLVKIGSSLLNLVFITQHNDMSVQISFL